MPVGVVWIVHRIHTPGMYRVFDVEQNSIAGARTRCQPHRRKNRDVMALVRVFGLLRAGLAMSAAVIKAVYRAGASVDKKARVGYYFRVLGSAKRDLDYVNAKECCVRVFIRLFI